MKRDIMQAAEVLTIILCGLAVFVIWGTQDAKAYDRRAGAAIAGAIIAGATVYALSRRKRGRGYYVRPYQYAPCHYSDYRCRRTVNNFREPYRDLYRPRYRNPRYVRRYWGPNYNYRRRNASRRYDRRRYRDNLPRNHNRYRTRNDFDSGPNRNRNRVSRRPGDRLAPRGPVRRKPAPVPDPYAPRRR